MTDATTKTLPQLACKVSTSASKALLIEKLRLAGYTGSEKNKPSNLVRCVMVARGSSVGFYQTTSSSARTTLIDFPEACRILDELIEGTTPAKKTGYVDAMPVRTFDDGTILDGNLIDGVNRKTWEASFESMRKRRDELTADMAGSRTKLRRHDRYLAKHGKKGGAA